jgi:hypothetical protein
LVPVKYLDEPVPENSRIVRITPFKPNLFVTQHGLQAADLKEHKWILKYGKTDIWYDKPQGSFFKKMKAAEGCDHDLPDLPPLFDARRVSLETPRLWASRALTAPIDDKVYDFTAGSNPEGAYTSTCHQSSDEKSEALKGERTGWLRTAQSDPRHK